MKTQYGPEDVFYVEFKEYGNWGCTAYEGHTGTKVEADTKEEARAQMINCLKEWDLSRPEPDAAVLSVEAISIDRSDW